MPTGKGQTNKQWSTKNYTRTNIYKGWATRTPLKSGKRGIGSCLKIIQNKCKQITGGMFDFSIHYTLGSSFVEDDCQSPDGFTRIIHVTYNCISIFLLKATFTKFSPNYNGGSNFMHGGRRTELLVSSLFKSWRVLYLPWDDTCILQINLHNFSNFKFFCTVHYMVEF